MYRALATAHAFRAASRISRSVMPCFRRCARRWLSSAPERHRLRLRARSRAGASRALSMIRPGSCPGSCPFPTTRGRRGETRRRAPSCARRSLPEGARQTRRRRAGPRARVFEARGVRRPCSRKSCLAQNAQRRAVPHVDLERVGRLGDRVRDAVQRDPGAQTRRALDRGCDIRGRSEEGRGRFQRLAVDAERDEVLVHPQAGRAVDHARGGGDHRVRRRTPRADLFVRDARTPRFSGIPPREGSSGQVLRNSRRQTRLLAVSPACCAAERRARARGRAVARDVRRTRAVRARASRGERAQQVWRPRDARFL